MPSRARLFQLVVPLAIAGAVARMQPAGAQQEGCRCATTFQGSGAARKVLCEGFNPQTHGRCECEQIRVDKQVGCRPLAAHKAPSQSNTPRAGSAGG